MVRREAKVPVATRGHGSRPWRSGGEDCRTTFMPLPVTIHHFSADLDSAKSYFNAAAGESDPQKQQALAALALAAAQIAHAEATWLASPS
jgi:hypothetical protein